MDFYLIEISAVLSNFNICQYIINCGIYSPIICKTEMFPITPNPFDKPVLLNSFSMSNPVFFY